MAQSKLLLLILMFTCLLTGCAGVAKMSDFPQTAETLDFDKLAKANYDSNGNVWNQQTEYEYFIEVVKVEEDELYNAIIASLIKSGYEISIAEKKNGAIIAERGMRLNEWNSITGVYYKRGEGLYQVFIKSAVTQDITGGWRENRAKNVVIVLCSDLPKCKTSPK